MKTEHFSGLTEAEQERVALLIEECSEVIQVACKILRHGYESDFKGQLPETNRVLLERELGDVQYALGLLIDNRDVSFGAIDQRRRWKQEHIGVYLHHQPDLSGCYEEGSIHGLQKDGG
jgi:hypothetical protein